VKHKKSKLGFGSASLDLLPYWTDADAAELDVLIWELVKVAMIHRERCATCAGERGILNCAPMGEAIEAVIDWRNGRVLKSKAAWLRARQAAREEMAAA
jgi:hypothetical protein